MIIKVPIGVTCAACGGRYEQEVSISTSVVIFEQLKLRIPCCGMCGDPDITLAIRVKDVEA